MPILFFRRGICYCTW